MLCQGYPKMTATTTNAAPTPTLRERILSMSSDELRAIVRTTKPRDRYGYEYKKALDELIARQIAPVVRTRQEDGIDPLRAADWTPDAIQWVGDLVAMARRKCAAAAPGGLRLPLLPMGGVEREPRRRPNPRPG